MTIGSKEVAVAAERVEARMFHGTSHLRYGKRACGPDCLGCNALSCLQLLVHMEACDWCIWEVEGDVCSVARERWPEAAKEVLDG